MTLDRVKTTLGIVAALGGASGAVAAGAKHLGVECTTAANLDIQRHQISAENVRVAVLFCLQNYERATLVQVPCRELGVAAP